MSNATFTPARAVECRAKVVANDDPSARYFMLRLERPPAMPEPAPGQFVHVAVPAQGRFFLRRPFSIHDCGDTLDLLVVEVGEGTRALRRARRGDAITFYGPLGHAFPELPGRRILAVGGGVGLAPLYMYGRKVAGGFAGEYRLLYGARNAADLFVGRIDLEGEGVRLASDDGSHGFRGTVVALAEAELAREGADVIFSCGPTVMMRAAQKLAERAGLPHHVSLENRMGCALGACRACVVPTKLGGASPYRTVCHDGPVFAGADLDWDALPVP